MALTRPQLESALYDFRVSAFLNVLGECEGTGSRYDIIFSGITFSSYAQHPNRAITAGGYTSTAAGRYQFLYSTWSGLQARYGFESFGPHNQDLGAVALLNDCGALGRLLSGDLQGAVNAAKGIWPSLPGGTQQRRNWAQVQAVYNSTVNGRVVTPPSGLPTAITNPGGINLNNLPPDWGALPYGGGSPLLPIASLPAPPAASADSGSDSLALLAVLALILFL